MTNGFEIFERDEEYAPGHSTVQPEEPERPNGLKDPYRHLDNVDDTKHIPDETKRPGEHRIPKFALPENPDKK